MYGRQIAIPTHFRSRIWSLVASLLGLVTISTWATPEALAQFNRSYGQTSVPVFLPAPRELQRELSRAADDIEQENFVDAITRLDFILNGQDQANDAETQSEDYFLRARKGKPRISIKQEADRLINTLPPKGRDAYELAYGTEAAQQLKQAVAKRDYMAIGEISRRYGNTNAGEEATLLLGRDRLAEGNSVEAILHFQRLASNAHASERFGAELTLLHAMALQLSRRSQEARELLADLELPANSPLTKNLDAKNLNTLLAMVPSPMSTEDGLTDWPMFGGNLRRTGSTNASMPTRSFAWDLPNTDLLEQKKLSDYAKELHGTGVTPVLHPLLVGDWVLARSTDWLVGVPVKYGNRAWVYPSWHEKNKVNETRRNSLIKTRVWKNSLYGQFSSDAENAYLISNQPESFASRNAQGLSNELVALEIASDGKLKWIVGKDDANHEPKLQGMLFLGPPLPIGDSLFCVGERNGEIRVMELRKSDGKLLWSQQLAHVESYMRDPRGGTRRLAGINLAYADGVLVCPTSTGGVIGIELSQRRFMWGHEYKPRVNQVNRRPSATAPTSTWRDNWAMIDNGHLVLTPWDSDEIFCLDLLTGENLWKQKVSRNGALFVAAIHDDKIVVVSKDAITALSMDDGLQIWRQSLRGGPSGRGIKTGSHYMLATGASELIKIDLENGKIVDSIETIDPLGNLIASEDMIISQNALWLRAFYQRDKLEQRVKQQLAKNPNDPWALEHQGVLLLEDDKRKDGLVKLREAIANYPADKPGLAFFAKKRLVDQSFEMLLEESGPEALALARSIEPYLPESRKEQFLSVMTMRNQKEGRLLEAFQSNLELFERSVKESSDYIAEPSMKTFGKRVILASRWHRTMFQQLWRDATSTQRKQMQSLARKSLDNAPENKRWQMLQTMQDLDFLHPEYLDGIEQLLSKQGKMPYLEGALIRLAKSDQENVAARATSLLARLYLYSGQMVAAANQYHRLHDEFASVKVDGERSGAEVTETLLDENATLRDYYEYEADWSRGLVKANRSEKKTNNATQSVNGYQYSRFAGGLSNFMPLDSDHGPDMQLGMTWGIVRNGASFNIQLRDSLGQSISKLSTSFRTSRKGREPKILTYGHLVVGILDEAVVAMNGIHSGTEAINSELWKKSSRAVGAARASQIRKINFGKLRSASRRIETGTSGRSQFSLGSVSDLGVVLRRGGDLICYDPESGETLWMRDDLRAEAEVWGDEEFVFVHVPEQYPDGGGNARVFSVMDGTELESRLSPQQANRMRTFGSRVVTWSYDVGGSMKLDPKIDINSPQSIDDILKAKVPTPDKQKGATKNSPANRIELRNLFERTKPAEWSRIYDSQARATWVNRTNLAVFDPAAKKLDIISVLEGKDVISVSIDPEVRVDTLSVQQHGDLFIVILSENSDGKVNGNRLYRAPDTSLPLQSMEVYGFNADGEMTWGIPAKLKNFQQLPVNAKDVPILLFGRQTENTAGRSKRTFEAVAIDVRDGHAAFTSADTFTGAQNYEVTARRDSQQIDLVLPAQNGAWTLEFSDAPRAPSIPYGYAADITKKSGQGVGSIIKTLIPGVRSEESVPDGF